jgi:hypothetical protein
VQGALAGGIQAALLGLPRRAPLPAPAPAASGGRTTALPATLACREPTAHHAHMLQRTASACGLLYQVCFSVGGRRAPEAAPLSSSRRTLINVTGDGPCTPVHHAGACSYRQKNGSNEAQLVVILGLVVEKAQCVSREKIYYYSKEVASASARVRNRRPSNGGGQMTWMALLLSAPLFPRTAQTRQCRHGASAARGW